jgi:hypothetical protein
MAGYLAVFASLNQVAFLKRALYREGIYVEMMRTPQSLSATGCSFAVRCHHAEIPSIKEACRKWNIELGGIFEETEKGTTINAGALLEDE